MNRYQITKLQVIFMVRKVLFRNLFLINNLRNSAIQSEEIVFILRMWQRGSLSEHNDSKS